jgi:uncharacterized protein YjbJ (UPF0337 family)
LIGWHAARFLPGSDATTRRNVLIRKERKMSGAIDKAKGRVKEAVGALTDDGKLRHEGRVDQAAGKVKDATEKVVDRVKGALKE